MWVHKQRGEHKLMRRAAVASLQRRHMMRMRSPVSLAHNSVGPDCADAGRLPARPSMLPQLRVPDLLVVNALCDSKQHWVVDSRRSPFSQSYPKKETAHRE